MLRQTFPLALFFAAATANAALPDDALIDSGSKKLQGGDADGALADFARAQKQAPKDPRPHFLSGAALAQKKDAAGAEREYRAALAIDPKLPEVHNELATLLMERGRNADAIAELKSAVAIKPDLAEGWYNLGKAALRDKNCAVAVDAFGRAAKLMPSDADTFIDLSTADRKCNQRDAALAAARQAVKLAARNPDTHLNLAFALDEAGKHDDAAGEANVATRLNPQSATAWWALGNIEHGRKRFDAAIAALEKARAIKPAAAISDDLGAALEDKGDLDKAAATFREALAKNPKYSPARWHLAETLAAAHKCKDALAELTQLPPNEQHAQQAQKLRTGCK
jgi:Flp pilus assembly protein TadD